MLPEEATKETVLTKAEVEILTERFLLKDPAGAKATAAALDVFWEDPRSRVSDPKDSNRLWALQEMQRVTV